MKKIFYLLAGLMLVSFMQKPEEAIEGFWMGAYGAGEQMETMVVKFTNDRQIEWYRGEVKDENRLAGTYELRGDSVLLTCQCGDGKQFVLNGYVNRRKTYVDGNWEETDKGKGSFYLKKQKVNEYMTQP